MRSSPANPEKYDFDAENDADALSRHADMQGDKKRHNKALAVLSKRTERAKTEHFKSKALEQKVASGLKAAFPNKKK